MPELGKYADAVMSAYAVSIVLILALVGISLWRSRQVKSKLADIEAKRDAAR